MVIRGECVHVCHFVDIDEVVDHYHLNFLFIMVHAIYSNENVESGITFIKYAQSQNILKPNNLI